MSTSMKFLVFMNVIYSLLMLALIIYGWKASKGYRLLRKRLKREQRRIRKEQNEKR